MPLRGLTISPDKYLLKDGLRFRNIGLNCGGLLQRIYQYPSSYTPAAEQDAVLNFAAGLKVKILRIKVAPYWPADWTTLVNAGKSIAAATAADREAHYQKLDALLAKCAAKDIGVILNLFFRLPTASDLAGQTVRAGWLTASSATRNFVQAVTQEIAARYLTNDAVFGYELSNEVNHYNDATDATRGNYPNTGPGTLGSYSAANDIFRLTDWSTVVSWWNGVISAVDNQRIVLTGNGPNSYTRPSGVAGISTPLSEWHKEQVRDNPVNTGSIHWYSNVGYGSIGGRGLAAILTGVKHWQRQAGKAFVLGEFGNQPWQITNISSANGVTTITCADSFPAELSDSVGVVGTNTVLDNKWFTVLSINTARNTLTVANPQYPAAFSGSVKGLKSISGAKLTRMLDDVIASDVDVALWWMLDFDTSRPVGESLDETGNDSLALAILNANSKLGW